MRHQLQALHDRLDALEARLDRGRGVPCGKGYISPQKRCRKSEGAAAPAAGLSRFMQLHQETQARKAAEREQAAATNAARKAKDRATAAATLPVKIELRPDGQLLINGAPPAKALGGGAFGDTWMAETPSGPVVVKVDRLTNGDPLDRSHTPPDRATQRRNMVERERTNMQRAHELGLGPRPIGPVQPLLDGRLAFAYEMMPGAKLAADHRAMEPTPEAAELLGRPGARARYAAGIARIARTMADAGFDHGDLHGGNVLIADDGTPSLIDWGMAEQRANTLPHERAKTEAAALAVLGNHLVKVNEAITAGTGRRKPSIDLLLGHVMAMSWKAPQAQKAITDAFDEEQWAAGFEDTVTEPGRRIQEANALVKAGADFHDAERQVGLLPALPEEVRRAAEAARDRTFNQKHLDRFRRAVDRHYAAWGAA